MRFVQIQHGAALGAWDAHSGLKGNHSRLAQAIDQPIGGLLIDLERRGLLDETIVVFCHRIRQNAGIARHRWSRSPYLRFQRWMAGGGLKRGVVHGATDEIGFHASENRHYVTDIHSCDHPATDGLGFAQARVTDAQATGHRSRPAHSRDNCLKRVATMRSLLCVLLICLWGSSAAVADKPNIMFLLADDFTWEAVGYLQQTDIETPNLDRLARRGVTFNHAYNMGS